MTNYWPHWKRVMDLSGFPRNWELQPWGYHGFMVATMCPKCFAVRIHFHSPPLMYSEFVIGKIQNQGNREICTFWIMYVLNSKFVTPWWGKKSVRWQQSFSCFLRNFISCDFSHGKGLGKESNTFADVPRPFSDSNIFRPFFTQGWEPSHADVTFPGIKFAYMKCYNKYKHSVSCTNSSWGAQSLGKWIYIFT